MTKPITRPRLPMGPAPRPVADRVWEKVDQRGPLECWPWTAGVNTKGYGQIGIGGRGGSNQNAHRVVYELVNGPVPPGLHVDHVCRNRLCCNPAHLEAVPPAVNVVERGVGPSAINARKRRCSAGHPLSGENLVIVDGARLCRECRRRKDRERRSQRDCRATTPSRCRCPRSGD